VIGGRARAYGHCSGAEMRRRRAGPPNGSSRPVVGRQRVIRHVRPRRPRETEAPLRAEYKEVPQMTLDGGKIEIDAPAPAAPPISRNPQSSAGKAIRGRRALENLLEKKLPVGSGRGFAMGLIVSRRFA